MVSLNKLRAISEEVLTPFMESRGFVLVEPFGFVREGPQEIYYVIHADVSYGENLKVIVACHTNEMQELFDTPFPRFVSDLVAAMLEPGQPISYENGYVWSVATEGEAMRALKEVRESIEESALPFFDSIRSRFDLVDFIYTSMKKGRYGQVINRILAWRENERK